jgi:hypothetical protein
MGEMQLASKDLISIARLLDPPLLKQIDIVVCCNSGNSRTSDACQRFGLINRHGASHFSLLDFSIFRPFSIDAEYDDIDLL